MPVKREWTASEEAFIRNNRATVPPMSWELLGQRFGVHRQTMIDKAKRMGLATAGANHGAHGPRIRIGKL